MRITKPFYLGQYEVTLGEFLMFYHQAPYKTEIERDGQAKRPLRIDRKTDPIQAASSPLVAGLENRNGPPGGLRLVERRRRLLSNG